MNDKFMPKINCRFKIRKDLDGFLGFFQGKGVLIFNEVGAFIVKQMTGEKSLREIEESIREHFPTISNPKNEVFNITKQFREAEFF